MTDLSDLHQLAKPHPVRAPRGSDIVCKNWLIEAAYRMIQNNLDREVAENPDALVVYGGIGIEVVLDHPVGGFDQPVPAGDGGAARCPHRMRLGELVDHGEIGHGCLDMKRIDARTVLD